MRLYVGDGDGNDSQAGNDHGPASCIEFLPVAHTGTKFHQIVLHSDGRDAVEVGIERRDGGSSDGCDDEPANAKRQLCRNEMREDSIRLQQLASCCRVNDGGVGRQLVIGPKQGAFNLLIFL